MRDFGRNTRRVRQERERETDRNRMLLSPPVRKVPPGEQSGSAGWLWEDLELLHDVGGQRMEEWVCGHRW